MFSFSQTKESKLDSTMNVGLFKPGKTTSIGSANSPSQITFIFVSFGLYTIKSSSGDR